MWRQAKLHVASTLDSQRADDLEAGGAEELVLLVIEGLGGRDHDAIACVDAHGVKVLHIANCDAGVIGVPHHFILDLFPAFQRAFQQHLIDGAGGDACAYAFLKLLFSADNTAAGTAEGIGGPDHKR